MQASSFTVGRRIINNRWGHGRIFAIDKLNDIAYVEWDAPWTKHGACKSAHTGEFIRVWCEVDSGDPQAV